MIYFNGKKKAGAHWPSLKKKRRNTVNNNESNKAEDLTQQISCQTKQTQQCPPKLDMFRFSLGFSTTYNILLELENTVGH